LRAAMPFGRALPRCMTRTIEGQSWSLRGPAAQEDDWAECLAAPSPVAIGTRTKPMRETTVGSSPLPITGDRRCCRAQTANAIQHGVDPVAAAECGKDWQHKAAPCPHTWMTERPPFSEMSEDFSDDRCFATHRKHCTCWQSPDGDEDFDPWDLEQVPYGGKGCAFCRRSAKESHLLRRRSSLLVSL